MVIGYKMLRKDYSSLRAQGRVHYPPDGSWVEVPGNGAYVAVDPEGLRMGLVGPVIVRVECERPVRVDDTPFGVRCFRRVRVVETVQPGMPVVWPDGRREWYRDGLRHREDGPAVEWPDGSRYYQHGRLHRTDGPAVEWADGVRMWYWHGRVHREDGPAVESADGSREWWQHGKRHRTDGPAIELADGTREWYRDGLRQWWRDGVLLPEPAVGA